MLHQCLEQEETGEAMINDEDSETIWNFLCDIVIFGIFYVILSCVSPMTCRLSAYLQSTSTVYITTSLYSIFHVLFVGISPSMLHCHRHSIDTKWILFGLHVKLKCDLNILSTPYL